MAASAVLAITIVPVLMTFFIREEAFDPATKKGHRRLSGLRLSGPPAVGLVALWRCATPELGLGPCPRCVDVRRCCVVRKG